MFPTYAGTTKTHESKVPVGPLTPASRGNDTCCGALKAFSTPFAPSTASPSTRCAFVLTRIRIKTSRLVNMDVISTAGFKRHIYFSYFSVCWTYNSWTLVLAKISFFKDWHWRGRHTYTHRHTHSLISICMDSVGVWRIKCVSSHLTTLCFSPGAQMSFSPLGHSETKAQDDNEMVSFHWILYNKTSNQTIVLHIFSHLFSKQRFTWLNKQHSHHVIQKFIIKCTIFYSKISYRDKEIQVCWRRSKIKKKNPEWISSQYMQTSMTWNRSDAIQCKPWREAKETALLMTVIQQRQSDNKKGKQKTFHILE